MIALRQPDAAFSFADYLAWEETQTERHEFVGGVAHAMTGGEQAHHEVAANAFAELLRIYGDDGRVYSQGFKVRVRLGLDDRAYYPDVFVTCQPGSPDALYNEHPCIVVEVLSDSTRRVDLGEKLESYTQLASLANYLVIDPMRAVVRVWRRSSGWQEEAFTGLDARIPVECGAGLPSGVLYSSALYRHVFGQ